MTATTKKRPSNTPFIIGRLLLFFGVLVMCVGMQYHYWYGENGYYAVKQLQHELINQTSAYNSQLAHNAKLVADVYDLKTGLVATEEYARRELGLIKKGEVFVQLSTAPLIYSRADRYEGPTAVEVVDPTISDIENP